MSFGISFVINGEPVAKGRPRFRNTGKFVQTYTPKKTLDAEKLVRQCFKDQHPEFEKPFEGPVMIDVHFHMPIPSSLSKKKQNELRLKPHVKKPDLDNLVKTVCDALNGYVWKDDSQIYMIIARKSYGYDFSYTKVRIGEFTGEE